MKHDVSWTAAVLLAVAAFFGISQHTGPSGTNLEQPATAQKSAKRNNGATRKSMFSEEDHGGCQGIVETLQTFFLEEDAVAPGECFDDGKAKSLQHGQLSSLSADPFHREKKTQLPKNQLLQQTASAAFLIATLPDPEKTHLSLLFDRLIVAIQKAASGECLTFDSSSLPWRSSDTAYTRLPDQTEAQQRHEAALTQPGVLLFRPATEGELQHGGARSKTIQAGTRAEPDKCRVQSRPLIVFVVGETPTAGMNKQQFLNAVAWLRILSGGRSPVLERGHQLNILGPYSSGSFSSLRQIFDSSRQEIEAFRDPKSNTFLATVATGTANAKDLIQQISPFIPDKNFADFYERDDLITERLLASLNSDHRNPKVAILSEDETAFGSQKPDSSHPLSLTYPRDISRLRTEYEKAALLTSPAAGQSSSTALRLLPMDILKEDESNQSDSVASYSGNQNVLSEEAELLQVIDILKAQHIQFVILRGSNPMDQIFLAQFFRRAYPQARIILENADALLFRGRGQESLNGILTVSCYPLISEMHDWIQNSDGGERLHFTGDSAEGEYNAARYLMHTVLDHTETVLLPDYATPDWFAPGTNRNQDIPPVWLSAISGNRVWPVDGYPAETRAGSRLHRLARGGRKPAVDLAPVCASPPPFGFLVLAVVPLLFALWEVFRSWRAPSALGPEYPRHQRYVAITWSSIVVMAVTSACFAGLPWHLFSAAGGGCRPFYRTLPFVIALLIAVAAPFALAFWKPGSAKLYRRGTITAPIVTAIVTFLLSFALLSHLTNAQRELMFWRGLSPLSGVSPTAPILALAVGAYFWSIYRRAFLLLVRDDRPLLPSWQILAHSSLFVFARDSYYPIRRVATYETRRNRWIIRIVLLLAIAVPGVFLQRRWGALQALDPWWFAWSDQLGLLLAAAVVLSETVFFWEEWRDLRTFLDAFANLPLRRTLIALKDFPWKTLWSMTDNSAGRTYFIDRIGESATHLRVTLPITPARLTRNVRDRCAALERYMERFKEMSDGNLYGHFRYGNRLGRRAISTQAEIASMAGFLLSEVLLPAWTEEGTSLTHDCSDEAALGHDQERTISLAEDLSVRHAEEFVCLSFLARVQNVLGRLRNLVLGVVALFLALVVAAVLAFGAVPAITATLLLLFLCFALPMLVVFRDMHRNAALSYVTDTKPGELGMEFWVHAGAFTAGPILALITISFPQLADWLFSLLQHNGG